MKKIIFTLTMLVALLVSSVAMAAASLVDNAGLLNAPQHREVLQVLQKMEREQDIRIAVVTMSSIGNASPKSVADKLIDNVYNDGKNGNMVLLQVIDQRQWYISTDAKLKDVTGTGSAVNYMSKAFTQQLSKGDYVGAYKTYAARANDLLAYHKEHGKPVTQKEEPLVNEPALVFALFGAFIFTKSVRKSLINSMSNVREAAAADAYLDERSFELTDSSDTYMYSNVVAVPRARGNGSHGGGGSGGHGGGGGGY